MFAVVLYQPCIPPNTGNIIRLCANCGCELHLIEPLGFSLDEPRLRRAGLDYHEWAEVRVHDSLDRFLDHAPPRRLLTFSRQSARSYTSFAYEASDAFLFGSETDGLPSTVREGVPTSQQLTIPLRPDNRSLNLSNAVAVVCYEAWRQHGFQGAAHL